MKLIKMKCENCGATLDVNKNLEKITCNYCGAEILIDDDATKLKRVEEAKLKARKDNHEQGLKERNDLLEQEIKEKKVKEELNSVDNFKKSKLSKVLLVFFAIAIFFFFIGSGFLVKFLTLLQAGLFISSWLMGMKIIKEPLKGIRIGLTILAFILIVPIINTGGDSTGTESEKIVWNDISMHEILPEPSGNKGQILTNSDENLSIYIHKQTKEDYDKYVETCKKKGFTIDSENDTNSFDAFNEDGYKLRIYYSDYSEEYHIDLEAPLEMKENAWPNSSLSNMLPKPKSTKGNVESDSSKYFTYYAAETSTDDFTDFVSKVQDSGFDVDHYKTEISYSAKNKSGYKVSISYEGFNIMRISITTPEEKEEIIEKEDKEISQEETTTKSSNNDLRDEFKASMDSYEEYMDEYVQFMKKYSESDGSDLSLLKDYSEMMTKYENFVKDFEKWEDEDLNDAETKYYIEVQTRVNKKLASIY